MLPNVLRPNATDHIPVLAEEVREALAVRPGETVVDATFGSGGHAELLAADLRGKGKLIAIDRDPSARAYFDRFRRQTAVQGRFLRGEFSLVLEQLGVPARAEGRVDEGFARAQGKSLPDLLGQDGNVISRAWSQDVRQHAPHSLRSPSGARARPPGPTPRGGP